MNGKPIGERFHNVIIADGATGVYQLVQPFDTNEVQPILILGSDTILADGKELQRSEYYLDPEKGQVVFFVPPPEMTVLDIRYRCLLFDKTKTPQPRRQPQPVLTEETLVTVLKVDTSDSDTSAPWRITGDKSFGISIGSAEGIGINQATRIALFGRVEDVEIEAELSDQSSPIAPEGTTLELEELDRILINVRGKGWQGVFGDVELSANAGGLGTLNRRALGGVLKGEKGIFSGSAGYAQPRGEFGRVTLTGIDGVQGPYLLAPDGRWAEIVPGSEQVYLDGRKMTRGWDADYTIDYSTGELYFTNRHIITSRKRIEAEFQFVTFEYQRQGFSGEVRIQPAPFELALSFFQEKDNPQAMLSEDLTAEQKEFLKTIGNDTSRAWLPGGEFVGLGNGDYLLENGHYRFAGRGKGDYRVRFTLKGDSQGAYVYDDSLIAFRYVGPGMGNYVDSFKVTLPKEDDIAYGKGGFNYQGLGAFFEGAFRRNNVNLFAKDIPAIDANAVAFGINWENSPLGMSFRHQARQQNFNLPGATPEIDFSYRWAGTKREQAHYFDEILFQVKPIEILALKTELGRLQRFDDTTINRLGGSLQVSWFSLEGFKAGSFSSLNTEITPAIGWFYPRAGWNQEVKEKELNRTYLAGGKVKPGAGFDLGLTGQLTMFDGRASTLDAWEDKGRAQIIQLELNQELKEILRLSGIAGFQGRSYTNTSENNWQRFFGTLNATSSPFSGLRLGLDLNQSYRQVQLKDEQFRYVGPGKGSYRLDTITGGYVYDPDGDYERLVVYLGRFAAARDFSLNGSGSFTGFEPVDFSGSFAYNRQSADTGLLSEAGSFNLIVHSLGFGALGSEKPGTKNIELTLGASGDFNLDRTLRITGKRTSRNQEFLELRSERIPEIEMQLRAERADILRRFSSGEIDYEERGWLFSFMPVIGTTLRLETGLAIGLKKIAEPFSYPELGKFNLNSTEAWLARNWFLGKGTRLRTQAGMTFRWADVSYLPFDVDLTQPLGRVPAATLELEHLLSEIFTLSGRYSFTDRKEKPAQHNFSLQLRAYF